MEDTNSEAPSLNLLGKVAAKVLEYGNNASHNLQDTYNNMTPKSWIRLIMIVGGYLLMRPYILKWTVKGAVKNMEDADEKEKAQAAMTPNELRGAKKQLEEHLEDDDEGDGTGADWGQKARVRQRTLLKAMLEAEEQKRMEEEEDKDIAEFLED